ncbi:hypothetical protein MMP65_04780 [Acinetobacter sp. ANC 3926]|uniref:RHS repeat-associated core domain-containing protein n=1 Tax=Acinetobacter genomosp. 15BJ TaxID=106651 RepID=UPI001F4B6CD7|nr:hypothetical protein [Acinetobacter genomosp. 15BJ]
MLWRWDGDQFGDVLANEDVDQNNVTFNLPLRHAGQYYDAEVNLFYNFMRDYDPVTGRYAESDPLGLFDGPNTYAYAYSNPVSYNDPTGQFVPMLLAGAAVGALTDFGIQLALNGGNLDCVSWTQVGLSGALGAFSGVGGNLVGKALLPKYLKTLSRSAKGDIGEYLSIIKHTLKGNRLIKTQAKVDGLTTKFDSVWKTRNGSIFYVESKFGTSGLTKPQRIAQKVLGDTYKVDKWTYLWFSKVGGNIGTVMGSSTTGFGTTITSENME